MRPFHVVLRLQQGLPSLRRKDVFRHLREAVKRARRKGLAVTHFSVLGNHIHFVVESERPLGRSIQSLAVSLAKRLNLLLKRTGAVFRDRYFSRVIRGAREARNVLRYVVANDAIHRSRETGGGLEIRIDPYSSVWAFCPVDLLKLFDRKPEFTQTLWSEAFIQAWHSEILVPPQTWLLRQGWKN